MTGSTYTDGELARAVAISRSWRGVLRELGLNDNSASACRSARRRAARLGLDVDHFTGGRRWTVDELAAAVAASTTWAEVVSALGLSGASSQIALKGHAVRMGIDITHLGRGPQPPTDMARLRPDPAHLARSGSLLAAAWFSLCGYEIAWPLEPCHYDIIASRDGELLRVQVKTTRSRPANSWLVSLGSTSRSARGYDPDEIDYFFLIDGDLEYYLIPVAVVGGLLQISLSKYHRFRLDRSVPSTSARLQPT
ncbi:group I intron-associated PD-(D/E)XK endonuclease [Nocardioides dilutus]